MPEGLPGGGGCLSFDLTATLTSQSLGDRVREHIK